MKHCLHFLQCCICMFVSMGYGLKIKFYYYYYLLGSVKMQSAQLPQVTEFKYLGSTLQSDGDMNKEVNARTRCGWHNWRKMSFVLCNKIVPPHGKGNIHKMIVQPSMLYGMETVPVTSYNEKKLEVTEMKMCRWECGRILETM